MTVVNEKLDYVAAVTTCLGHHTMILVLHCFMHYHVFMYNKFLAVFMLLFPVTLQSYPIYVWVAVTLKPISITEESSDDVNMTQFCPRLTFTTCF